MIKFKFHSTFSTADLFRIQFNTAFIGTNNTLEYSRWEISPESVQKDYEKFSEKFKCVLLLDNFCKQGCQSHNTTLDKLCRDCKTVMLDEVDKWREATWSVQCRRHFDPEEARQLLNGDINQIEAAQSHRIKWEDRQQNFKITRDMFK